MVEGLGDYIGRIEPISGILSSFATARQSRSSAFAEQFLAPAQVIRDRLRSKRRDEDMTDKVVCESVVPSEMNRPQIGNR